MNKIPILLFICLLMVSSCINHSTDAILVAEKSGELINPIDSLLLDSIPFSSDRTDLLFIVDASCSICIGHFMDELSMIKKTNLNRESMIGNKYIILPEGTTPTTRWYVSQESYFPISDFHFIELSSRKYSFIYEFNGYFFTIENGHITESWIPVYN